MATYFLTACHKKRPQHIYRQTLIGLRHEMAQALDVCNSVNDILGFGVLNICNAVEMQEGSVVIT